MGSFSWIHWLVVIALIALLFGGRGKISSLMGDVAHGIRNFRDGLKDPNDQRAAISESKQDTAEIKNPDEIRR